MVINLDLNKKRLNDLSNTIKSKLNEIQLLLLGKLL